MFSPSLFPLQVRHTLAKSSLGHYNDCPVVHLEGKYVCFQGEKQLIQKLLKIYTEMELHRQEKVGKDSLFRCYEVMMIANLSLSICSKS